METAGRFCWQLSRWCLSVTRVRAVFAERWEVFMGPAQGRGASRTEAVVKRVLTREHGLNPPTAATHAFLRSKLYC